MKTLFKLVLIASLFGIQVYSQVNSPLGRLKQQFESFEYNKVLTTADSLLKNTQGLSTKQLIEIYKVKGISEYSLLDEANAKKSFVEIVKMDSNYTLDSTQTSPKIVVFFEKIKSDYLKSVEKQNRLKAIQDTLFIPKIVLDNSASINLKNAMIRSLALPGLGHLYLGEKTKGIILTGLSVVTLGSVLYFIIDSNKKQNDYLDETNQSLIPQRYNDYNTSYKLKNISIIAFAAVWLYSQIDLLFFNDYSNTTENLSQKLPAVNYDNFRGMQISYTIPF